MFNIYTTGIAEWYNLNLLAKKWNETIRDIIIDKIPFKYKIKIIHSDILLELKPNNITKEKILDDIYTKVCLEDINSSERIIESNFISTEHNYREIELSKDYIILDFAHIFSYNNKNKIKDNNIYNLNVLYLGYLSIFQIDEKFSFQYMLKSNFLNIEEDNIITYIDKMIELNYIFEPSNPNYKIKEIFIKIRIKLMNEWRKKYGKVSDDFDNRYNSHLNSQLVYYIIDYIMNNYLEDELINILYNKYLLFL
jgi:hypothetical protein